MEIDDLPMKHGDCPATTDYQIVLHDCAATTHSYVAVYQIVLQLLIPPMQHLLRGRHGLCRSTATPSVLPDRCRK